MIITDFYANSEIFITGGSGVVGKALIDKLLRSCNVKRIYVLLRPKKDQNAEQRLLTLRKAKIFGVLKQKKPEELRKLVAIPGDAMLPTLGITEEYVKIMENVSCIFHCAATVRFDEPLKWALKLNVAGTLEALKFAMKLKKLKAFMHCSTFYSNPYAKYVEPKVYPSPLDWRLCLKILDDNSNDDNFDILTKKLIMGFPNTYTFTKNLAESMVNEFRDRLPISIYRPSIVLFAIKDPVPGFSSSLMGAMGLFALAGTGLLKTVYISDTAHMDLTPQDLGIKTMIYYGAKTVEVYEKGTPAEAPVYMFSSVKIYPFTFKEMSERLEHNKTWEEAAIMKSLLMPGAICTSNYWIYMYRVFTCQILPALLVDFILRLMGRQPLLMGITRKAFVTLKVMEPFMFNEYDSPGISQMDTIMKELAGTEFDITDAILNAHRVEFLTDNMRNMAYKVREVLLHEDSSTLPKARRILKIKKIIYNVMRAIFYYYVLRWINCFLLRITF